MPIARINGLDTYYEEQGAGTPVLFIHGGFGGAESTMFPRPSSYLGILPTGGFRTITYERRNSGRTAYRNRKLRVQDLANDGRALLDFLEVEHAIVVGDSLGGQIAMQMALTWPQRVESLVLAETGARVVRHTAKAQAALMAVSLLPPRMLVKVGRKRILNPPFYDPLGPATPDLIPKARARHEEYKQALRQTSDADLGRYTAGILRNYAAFIGFDLRPRVPELKMPVEVIHGTADTVVSTDRSLELHELLPQSKLHLLPGLGHGLFYYPEARQLLAEILKPYAADPALVAERMPG